MLISVVIPHLNQPDFLALCLESLHTQQNTSSEFEIFVVDNGSHSLPEDVCDLWPDVTLLSETTPGPGPARNAGIAQAKGEILAFIDADCRAHPGWMRAIETAFSDPETLVIGGDVQVPYENRAHPTALEAYERIYAYRNKMYVASGYSGTGNLSMRAEVFAKVGPFGGIELAEDRDWGLRARAMGITTRYAEDMIIYHPARKSFDEMQRKWDRHIAHDFSRVSGGSDMLKWVVRAVAIAGSPVGELYRVATSDRIKGFKERRLAFACLTRIRFYRFRRMISVMLAGNGRSLSGAWNRE